MNLQWIKCLFGKHQPTILHEFPLPLNDDLTFRNYQMAVELAGRGILRLAGEGNDRIGMVYECECGELW